ncbi:MAG: AAA family ATPase [Caldilineaceae bacterium]|nr:AAA family ATPase [Caldilineaceae bacterium]
MQYDPLYEAGYHQLMQLYALQDDRARALHTYHNCVTVLERELGVPPGIEIDELYQQLLHTEPQSTGTRQPNLSTALQLVGRKAEWQRLRKVWRQAAQGCAHTVLIEGEAGIGKTRLAEELLEWVNRQGILSTRTRSYAAEGALAYAPVVEWLRSPALRRAIAVLDPVWRTELARLLPELVTQFPALPRPEPLTERWQRQRLFEALARVVTIDERPKLLLIDDLQWCDQETLEWLRFLLRFAANAPLLVVCTVRTGEVEEMHPLHALLRELRISNQLAAIHLTPLSAVETAELATQVCGDQIDVEATNHLVRASEGNPLFVIEMAQSGMWTVPTHNAQIPVDNLQVLPPKVFAVIQHRLAQLSPAARRLVALAATIGRSFAFDVLVKASDSDAEAVVLALDELWRHRIILEQGAQAYDFSHDRIREAAYAELSPIIRKRLHQRVAQTLEDLFPHDLDSVCGQLALHHERAGNLDESVMWYQRTAMAAWQLSAFQDATNHLRTALRLLSSLSPSRENRLTELRLQIRFADYITASTGFTHVEYRNALLRAKELTFELYDIDSLALIFVHLGSMYISLGDQEQVQIVVNQANTVIEQVRNLQGKAKIYGLYASVARYLGNPHQAVAMYTESLKFGEEAYQRTKELPAYIDCIKTSLLMATAIWITGYPQQAATLAHDCWPRRNRITERNVRTVMMFQAALLWRNIGADTTLAEEAEQMLNFGMNYEIALARQSGSVFSGWLLAKQGQLSAGIALTRQGIDGFRRMGHVMYQTHRLAMLVEMLLWAEQYKQAAEILQEAFEISEHHGERFWDVELYRLQGDLLLAQGKAEHAAETAYLRAIEVAQSQGAKSLELRASTALCRLWQRQGRVQEAHQHLLAIYGWFTEGFDTHDLRVAQTLLQELSA